MIAAGCRKGRWTWPWGIASVRGLSRTSPGQRMDVKPWTGGPRDRGRMDRLSMWSGIHTQLVALTGVTERASALIAASFVRRWARVGRLRMPGTRW